MQNFEQISQSSQSRKNIYNFVNMVSELKLTGKLCATKHIPHISTTKHFILYNIKSGRYR